MLVVPITGKISLRNPPIITIAIILLNCFVFFVFQSGEDRFRYEAAEYYFESGLADIELPFYMRTTGADPDELDIKGNADDLNNETLVDYYLDMERNSLFSEMLRDGMIITEKDPRYTEWAALRSTYEDRLSRVVYISYGFQPAVFNPITMLTHMFLHGDFGHLLGNMIFLWLIGCILEMGCGRLAYLGIYFAGGVLAVLFFWLFNMSSSIPLVGASGAIAGLMGAFTVLYGRKKVNIFVTFFGFYFSYHKIPGIALLPFWVLMQMYELFFGTTPQVAYTAHIGGLLGGALIGYLLLRHTNTVDETIFEDEKKDEISPLMGEAMERIGNLEMMEGRTLLTRILEKEPANMEALGHLFHVDKLSPDGGRIHETTSRYIATMLRNRESHAKILSVYGEYLSVAHPPRLSPHLYVKISVLFSAVGDPGQAAGILSQLLKKKTDLPGLPNALLQLLEAYRKKGMDGHLEKCRKILVTRYPDSLEARAVQNR